MLCEICPLKRVEERSLNEQLSDEIPFILSRASYTHTSVLYAKPRNYVSSIYKPLPEFISTKSTVIVEPSLSEQIIVVVKVDHAKD
jgi:hypothetical protein